MSPTPTPSPTGRRSFLKRGAAGLAGAAFLPAFAKGGTPLPASQSNARPKLPSRTLGKTGLTMPILGMGAASEDPALYQRALDLGLVHIDTSQYYYNGRHEEMLGKALAGRPRDSFVIATSVLLGNGAPGAFSTFRTQDAPRLPEQMAVSLKRLALDHVDIFYVAGVNDRATALSEPFLASLRAIKESGKSRFVGLATHRNQVEVIRAAIESKLHEVLLVAWNFRDPKREEVRAAIGEAAAAGLGVVVMKPMAGGSWDREGKQPVNGQAALKWVLQDPNVTAAVPGIDSVGKLESDLAALRDLALTPQERTDLKLDVDPEPGGLFCAQCRSCAAQCPSAGDVPTLMRGYMYAYGYRDLGWARGALDQADLSAVKCGDCGACGVRCTMGFDIQARVRDILRLKDVPQDFLGGF